MRYPARVVWGRLLRRYRRFLADVEIASATVTAHVPNSGRMTGCSEPGSPCLVLPALSTRRRLAWTLEQVFAGGVPVGVHTGRANRLAEEALVGGVVKLPGLGDRWSVRREVVSGPSRFDLLLDDDRGGYWVEVKNITLVEAGVALFPDAVTARGARHVEELGGKARAGDRACVCYVVQRGDARRVAVDPGIDPTYARAMRNARRDGLVAVAVQAVVSPLGVWPWRELPVE